MRCSGGVIFSWVRCCGDLYHLELGEMVKVTLAYQQLTKVTTATVEAAVN